MRYIDLLGTGGPQLDNGAPDVTWPIEARALIAQLTAAPTKAARDELIEQNGELWRRLRNWLLALSHDKCWYSEARDSFSFPEVEHYRPKCRCKRMARGPVIDGYWWLAFDWRNYRICGKVGNSRKGDFFPLAAGSPVAVHGGVTIANEIPLLLDPASPGDPDLLSFNEDGACAPHADADAFSELRVSTTVTRMNLNHGRLRKARQRIWDRCWKLVEECRDLALQLNSAAGPAERDRLNQRKEELRRMIKPEAEFSSVAKTCLLKSNIKWAQMLAAG